MNTNYLKKVITKFKSSKEYELMLKGDKYYKVENDILNRQVGRLGEGNVMIIDHNKPNNKLSHGIYKNMVDEKVSYILGKDFTMEGDKAIVETLDNFRDVLVDLAYDISNHGIEWVHICYNEQGELKLIPFEGHSVIPFWNLTDKDKLDMLIRFYTVEIVDENGESEASEKIEVWYPDHVEFYIMQKGTVTIDSEEYIKRGIMDNKPCGHVKFNGQEFSWGVIPFVAFRNNRVNLNDLSFVKHLIDAYDLSRSDVSNYIEECRNLIYVLKNYGGVNLSEFMSDLSYYRAIKVNNDGGIETLEPSLDITASKEHYEQLKRDILEFGQGVYKDIDNLGGNVSGIMLKMLYSTLELKTDIFGRYFTKGLNGIAKLIGQSLGITDTKIKVTYNKDMVFNESEVIDNLVKSSSILSERTIVANHPYVGDVEEELQRKKEDEEEDIFNNPLAQNINIEEE